jgi:hypothetical protein
MDKYIDVLGYLLAAVVFSVSFLGARVHATYDATAREIREQSWRVRNALLRGDPVGPPELRDAVAVAHRTTDRVAKLSLVINRLLFTAMTIGYAGAIWLLVQGQTGPPWPYLITSLVFMGGIGVIVIGEFDVRNVGSDQRAAISGSLVGALSGLADAFAAQRWQTVGERLAGLSDLYPDWALLTELRAYLDLRKGNPSQGLQRVRKAIAEDGHLYLAPVVGTACALGNGDPAAGLRLLETLAARSTPLAHLAPLRAGLALSWAHIETMTQGTELMDGQPTGQGAVAKRLAAVLPQRAPSAEALLSKPMPLDIKPAEIPQTAGVLRLLDAWVQGSSVKELEQLAEGSPLAWAVRLMLAADTDAACPGVPQLLELEDSATLETFGLIFLARGRTRDALRMVEHSIRLSPGNYGTHWAMAVTCHRLGWDSAAASSLQKMNTLMPDTWLHDLTQMVFHARARLPDPHVLSEFRREAGNAIEWLQLALLGIHPEKPIAAGAVREIFLERFMAAALHTASRKLTRAGDSA